MADMDVYPLIFKPIFKPKIWGGRRLSSALGKDLPGDEPIGESWEMADLEDDQSVVRDGPAAGMTLGQLVSEWGAELLGRAELFDGRFPLLIKFLDANDTLSVQVHPDQAMADRLGGRVRVKNEAWYVVDATDEGFIYRGVKQGVDALRLASAIADGTVESLMNRIPVRKGHCYYLPSGTLHALGKGVLVAEVQTPSDITYRVFDFNRVEKATGRPRELHVEQAMECISFDTGPIAGEERQHVASVWTSVTSLVRCDSFVIERVRMVDGVEQAFSYNEMVIWMVLEGTGLISWQGGRQSTRFRAGDTVLIPAGIQGGQVKIEDATMWLEVSLPIRSSLEGFDRPEREQANSTEPKFVNLNRPGKEPM
ncbi:MAG: type I phosphomannose isomerase catalytic subunit [Planctomycetota bacterium]